MIFIDVETTGLNPRKDKLHGVGSASEEDMCHYELSIPGGVLNDLCGHNIRFDAKFLIMNGITLNGKLFDTLTLAQLLNENQESFSLEACVEKYLGKEHFKEEFGLAKFKGIAEACKLGLSDVNNEVNQVISEYCKSDVNNTLKLWHVLYLRLQDVHKKMIKAGHTKTLASYYIEECVPMEKVLAKMELQGVKVDVSRIMEYKKELENEEKTYLEKLDTMCDSHIRRIENDLYEQALSLRKTEAGKKRVEVGSEKYGTRFNWGSNQHIGKILYEGLSVPAQYKKKTKSGQWDTSEAQLCEIERVSNGETKTFLQDFAKYKKVQKLLSTYTGDDKGLLGHVENGRIYPSFIQGGGPVTGRLACREPNLQNLPRGYPQIKRFFVPDAGRIFCYFDYSQVELRIAAHLSNDPVMLRGFNEGRDLHAATAKRIFGSEITKEQRQVGKQINFATIYDASAYRLEALFEGRYTVEECEAFRKGFFNLYCGYSRYLENTKQSLIRDGYTVSHFGRVRRLPELKEYPKNSKEFKHAIKQGLNFNIQSFAASICKRTMIALYNERYELVTQVHDSVIISLAIDSDLGYNIKRIQEIAENIVTLKVPLKAEVKLLNSFDEGDEYANGHSKTG